MYYKIIKNNSIIDIGSIFLYWRKKSRTLLGCKPEVANYLRTDSNNTYETEWLRSIPDGAPRYEKVSAEIITKEEYDRLKNILQKEEAISIPQPEPFIEEEIPVMQPAKTLDYASATTLLISLTEQYNELIKRNQFLEDCLLELSQEIYK